MVNLAYQGNQVSSNKITYQIEKDNNMDYEPVNLLFPGDVNQPLILLEVTLGNTSVVP